MRESYAQLMKQTNVCRYLAVLVLLSKVWAGVFLSRIAMMTYLVFVLLSREREKKRRAIDRFSFDVRPSRQCRGATQFGHNLLENNIVGRYFRPTGFYLCISYIVVSGFTPEIRRLM